MSQSAGRNPLLLAGLVIFFTVLLGLAAFGVNRIVNPPTETSAASCPAPPSGHPATNAKHAYTQAPPMSLQSSKQYTAVLCTTRGVIRVALKAGAAPKTVNAFVFLANNGYYDGLTFHRVCPSASDTSCGPSTGGIHIAQGGDPKGDGSGRGPGFTIPDEPPTGKYVTGTVALARPSNPDGSKIPNSSGSQFFINTGTNNFAPDYNLFGEVTSGLGAAQKLIKGDVMFWVAIETSTATSPAPSASGAASPAASTSASPAAVKPSPSPS